MGIKLRIGEGPELKLNTGDGEQPLQVSEPEAVALAGGDAGDVVLGAEEPAAVRFSVRDLVRQGGGTSDYEELENKPLINGNVLSGDQTGADLGLVDEDVLGNYYTDAQVDDILENNYYTMDQVDEKLEEFTPSNMIPVLWADLVQLRDDGELVPGAYYRITDYEFITSKLGVQSGGHQFDIVLLAISESMLSESGYAVKHAGEHYFEREITVGGIEWLYTLYVDDYAANYGDEPVDHPDDIHSTDVFCASAYYPHPDDPGWIVPVLFKTDGEEYDFDDPDYNDRFYWEGEYDLDGDLYDMWGKYEPDGDDGWTFMEQYALTPIVVDEGTEELMVSPIPETKVVPVNMNAWELKYCLDNDKDLFGWADTNGKGVIYYLKDEFGNEAPYDFKNVKYARRYISGVDYSVLNNLRYKYAGLVNSYGITTSGQTQYFYTFHDEDADGDASLFGNAAYNEIETWIVDGKKELNDIVVYEATGCRFGINAHDITIAGSAAECDLKGDNVLIGNGASNVRGTLRNSTMIGVSGMEAASGAREIVGSQPSGVKFTGNCFGINLGFNLTNTEIGGGCQGITFSNYSNNNKIGSNCNTITFGNYCNNIKIGDNCNRINFSNYYRYIDIAPGCFQINLQTTGGGTTNYVQNVNIGEGVNNVNLTPTRNQAYEQNYYKTGRTEQAV